MGRPKAFYILPINPEPWVVPPMSPGRVGRRLIVKAGRDTATWNYKEAIKEELIERGAVMLPAPYRIHFLFYRQQATYELASGRKNTKNEADATNMQKLTEDALQGVLIDDDKDSRHITSQIVEQGKFAPGMVGIFVTGDWKVDQVEIPKGFGSVEVERALSECRTQILNPVLGNNEWPTNQGGFSVP